MSTCFWRGLDFSYINGALLCGSENACVGSASGTLIFQGKMAFGVLGPVSVSAARRRLEAGAAKAPQGRRGQVSFGISQVKVLHLMGA